MSGHRVLAGLATLVLFAATVLAACDTDTPGPEGAQPGSDTERFTQSVVDELPRFPRSEEVAPTSKEGDTVTSSLLARDTTPGVVIDFYVERLGGWNLVEGPTPATDAVVWADWIREISGTDQRLRVTATSSTPTVEDDTAAPEETDVQIDIVLYPDDEQRPPPG